jgi:hypothetical protein
MSILNQISQSQLSANTSSEGVQSDNKNNTNTDNTLLSPKDKIKVTSQIDPLKQSNLAPLPGSATGIFTSQINPLNKSNLAPISGSVRGISTSQINPLNKSNLGPVLNIPNNRVGVISQINPLNKSNLSPAPGSATSQNFIQTSFDGSKIIKQSIIPIINPTPEVAGWLFYSPDNEPASEPPINNGDTIFIADGIVTYNPNYTGALLTELYFNINSSDGTSYLTQFTELVSTGGTITISQGSNVVIYSGTSSDYVISDNPFLVLRVTRPEQMIQPASASFVLGLTINLTFNNT